MRAGTTGAVGGAPSTARRRSVTLHPWLVVCPFAPTANVLVIGSGGTVLRAAVAAHQAGAEVVVAGRLLE